MKIAIFTDLFLPHVDGVTNSLVHLISQYRNLGHDVLVITPKTKGSERVSISQVEIVFLPSVPSMVYPEFMLGFFSSKLLFKLKSFSPEIVHVIAPGPVGSMGLFYAKLMNVKSVATFHGYFMEPEYLRIIGIKKRGVKLAQKFLWRFTKTFYDRADLVITPSKFVKKDLENHDFSRPIIAVKNAINFENVTRNEEQHRSFVKKYQLTGKKVVLYIGRVSTEKNIDSLIKSFVFVNEAVPKAHLLVVGAGPELDNLKQLTKTLKLENHVTFTGEISNDQLVKSDVFSTATVFTTASHSEVQPISIIEAMYFGLPIIAVRSRGLAEMIKQNGFLVATDEPKQFSKKIIEILKDSRLQKKFAHKSKELAREYSLSKTASIHLELYADLISNRTSRHIFKSVLKLRIIRAFKDLIFLVGTTHITVLLYLFFLEEKIEYLNIFYILDLEKVVRTMSSTWELFILSILVVIVAYSFFFYINKKDEE